jgi:hypothetical protein
MKKILYAYFGKLGIFNDDIPGHSFYQMGLLDAIREKEGGDCVFDFYSYLPNLTSQAKSFSFPDDPIGNLNAAFADSLIGEYCPTFKSVTDRLMANEYSAIYLKARFRNLSTLAKGFDDAKQFESLIKIAKAIGTPVYILDTDLSLPDSFLESKDLYGFTRLIPSIDMPGIGSQFAKHCLDVNRNQVSVQARKPEIIYYGNLDFKNYKVGHHKNPIVLDLLDRLSDHIMFNGEKFEVIHAGKPVADTKVSLQIPRTDRDKIWQSFAECAIASINISKDLYLETGFLPARVYEAAMFGIVTVSFSDKSLHPAMGFNTVDEAIEQLTYLAEISDEDYFKLYEAQLIQIVNRGRVANK